MVNSDDASSGTQLLLQKLDEIQQNLARIEGLYDNTSTTMVLDEGEKLSVSGRTRIQNSTCMHRTPYQARGLVSVVIEEGQQCTVSRNTADTLGLLSFRVGIDPSMLLHGEEISQCRVLRNRRSLTETVPLKWTAVVGKADEEIQIQWDMVEGKVTTEVKVIDFFVRNLNSGRLLLH
jgi:hypothetical protein